MSVRDGFKNGLIGTPEQIARKIVALKAIGVDLLLGGFLHFIESASSGLKRFEARFESRRAVRFRVAFSQTFQSYRRGPGRTRDGP